MTHSFKPVIMLVDIYAKEISEYLCENLATRISILFIVEKIANYLISLKWLIKK